MKKLSKLWLTGAFSMVFLTACGLSQEEKVLYQKCLKDDSEQIDYIYENICETELKGLCKYVDGKAKTDEEKCYQIAQDRHLNSSHL